MVSSLMCVGGLYWIGKSGELDSLRTDKETTTTGSTDQQSFTASSQDRWSNYSKSDWKKIAKVENDAVEFTVGVKASCDVSLETVKNIVEGYGGELESDLVLGNETKVIYVSLPIKSVSSIVRELSVSSCCRYVEPNRKVKADFVPNDPSWSKQWGPQKIQADFAWNTTKGDSSVLVAVIDTGIDYTHPDLAPNYVALGRDWVNDDEDPLDDAGHGTHCAGIIAAVLNNGVGIAGLAQVKIMAEKVLDSEGYGYESDCASAIIHAASQGARILSCSWGGDDAELNNVVRDAIRYVQKEWGVLVVASAGNSGNSVRHYPACYDEVVAVSATNYTDDIASFSSYADWVDVAAPGFCIYSTMPTYRVAMNAEGHTMNYSYMSGTSMACPHVAGVVALILSVRPSLSLSGLRQALYYATDDFGEPGFDVYYGYGRINAKKAVEQSLPAHDLVISKWSKPNFIEPDNIGLFNATIYNFGTQDEHNVIVDLSIDGDVVDREIVDVIAGDSFVNVTLFYSPHVNGTYNVAIYARPVQGETNLLYNTIYTTIDVDIPKKIAVLYSSGTLDLYTISDVWNALNIAGREYGDQLIQIDYTSLSKINFTYEDIKATKADVLLISDAEARDYCDQEIEAICRYVYDGHGLVVTATLSSSTVPNNVALASLLGLNPQLRYKWGAPDVMSTLDPMHPLFKNVSMPVDFTDSGTWTSMPEDDCWSSNELQGGTYLALGNQGNTSIVEYRGCVYISTFLEGMYWYGGVSPELIHNKLQLIYNALAFASYQRPEHELVLSVKSPSLVGAYDKCYINATICNVGFNDETNVSAQMYVNGGLASSIEGLTVQKNESILVPFCWQPSVKGSYNVTVCVVGSADEDNTWNNIGSVQIMVVDTLPDILLVAYCYVHESPGSNWRSSAMEFSAALNELGIQYYYWNVTATQDTPQLDFLMQFKLVIWTCGERENDWGQITTQEAANLVAYVKKGGRLLLDGDIILASHAEDQAFCSYVTHSEWVCRRAYVPNGYYGQGATNGTITKIPNHPLAWELPKKILWRTYLDPGERNLTRCPDYVENASPINGGVAVFGYIDNPDSYPTAHATIVGWNAIVCGELNGMPSTVYLSFAFMFFPKYARTRFVSNVMDWLLNVRWWPHITLSMPNNIEPGQSFNLSIAIQNATNLVEWELELYYRNHVLNAATIVEGFLLSSVGTTTFQVIYYNNSYSATRGCIRFRCYLNNSSMPVNGSGVLATVIFKALATGKGLLTLGTVKLTTSTSPTYPYFYEDVNPIIGLLGDINNDGKINILDVVLVCTAYGSKPGYSNWNPQADVVPNDCITMLDVIAITSNYGKHET